MPTISAATTIVIHAYDTATGLGKTGDSANIALRVVADGTAGTIAGSVSEVDATNQPGVYKVTIASGENTGVQMSADGKSSTSGIVVVGYQWTNSAIFGTDGKALISTDAQATAFGNMATVFWAVATSALTTASSIGLKLKNWVYGTDYKALVSTDAQDVSTTFHVDAKTLNTASPVNLTAANVLDQTMSGHTTSGTAGGALNAAGSTGDPWNTPLPGAYTSGTAGYIIGTFLTGVVLTAAKAIAYFKTIFRKDVTEDADIASGGTATSAADSLEAQSDADKLDTAERRAIMLAAAAGTGAMVETPSDANNSGFVLTPDEGTARDFTLSRDPSTGVVTRTVTTP
jgi:hypothetical protein